MKYLSVRKTAAKWDDNPLILAGTIHEAQERFRNQLDTCRLFEYYRAKNPGRLLF